MGVRSHDPWRRALGSGLVLFGVALLLSVVIGPRIAPAATGAAEFLIVTGSDDAEQLVSGWLGLASSDLELVDEFSPQVVGLRFSGVSIPPGASITSAYIRFTVDEVGLGTVDLQVAAHDIGNASTFSRSAPVIGRPVTASVSWSPPPWPIVGASGVEQETIDLSPVVQAIIDRPDWMQGNAIAFVITGSGTRTADSFEGGHPPVLTMTWSMGPVSTTTTTSPPTTTTVPATTTTVSPTTTTVPPTTTTSSTTTTVPPATTTTTTTVPPTTTTTTTTVPPTTTTTTTTIPVSTASIDVRVAASGDDAEELPSGYLYSNSSDLELVEERVTQLVGIRFTGIDIPAGATITGAWIQFTVDELSTGTAALIIQAHDTADAAPFIGNRNISGRALTAAEVHWQPAPWDIVGVSGTGQRTPALVGTVQAIVDRPDWVAGNAIAFVITGTGRRTAESYNGSRGSAPLLHIEWTTGAVNPPTNQPPSVIATATRVTTGSPTILDATISDDGLPNPPGVTTVLWAQVSGPATATIANPTAATTSAVLPNAGDYVFRITVSDGDLQTHHQAATTATDPTTTTTTTTVPTTTTTTTTTTVPTTTTTPPTPTGTTRLAVIGDYGGDPTREQTLADLVDALDPDAVITVGDNVYWNGGYDRIVGQFFHQYMGAYTGAYGAGSATNRFFPTIGNHDYTDGGLVNYLSFFDLPGPGVASTSTSGNERYYDVRIGNVHVFVVNSNSEEPDGLTPTTVQGQWLQNALASSDAEWNIVVFHHPPYASLPGKTAQWMRWPFRAWGADLVLSGDAHAYERLESGGLTYVINGLGLNNTTLDRPRIPESQAFWSQNTPASLLIEACPGSLHVELHPVGYAVVDRFTIGTGTCP